MVAIARFQESRGPVELELERRGLERVVLHDKSGKFHQSVLGRLRHRVAHVLGKARESLIAVFGGSPKDVYICVTTP